MTIPITINVLLGVFLIGIGWYIQRTKSYHLIAGYKSLSPEEKKNFDIEKYARFFRNGFILAGLLVIVAYPLLKLFNMQQYVFLVSFFIIISWTVYLTYRGQKYFGKEKKPESPF